MRQGLAGPRQLPITPKFRGAITFKIDPFPAVGRDRPGLRADPEARLASRKCARQAVVAERWRREESWPASTDPTADSIEPPVAGGRAPGDGPTDTPAGDRIARFDERRAARG
jgi:hypothetical protein